MFWFLPLLLTGLGGFLAGYLTAWVIDYLDKQTLKEHIQQQEKQKFNQEVSKTIGKLLKSQEYNRHNVGLEDMLRQEQSTRITSNNPLLNKTKFELAKMLQSRGDNFYIKNLSFTEKDKKVPVSQLDYYDSTTEVMLELLGVKANQVISNNKEDLLNKTKFELAKMLQFSGDSFYIKNLSFTEKDKKVPISQLDHYDSTTETMLELLGAKTIDWVLEDEESRKIFAGRYYDGEVVSMEEVQAQEIDPELQWELDNQEIVIL